MTSVWQELKRRNVVRVAVAYLIVSWLILQFTDVLIPLLTLPTWIGRLVFLILLIGFPLAMFFAWAFELTPDGLKKEKHVDRTKSVTHVTGRKLDFIIIGVLAVALTFFAVDKYILTPDSASEIVAQQSIAVLPFVNMSSDPEQEYFSDGLSEEILNLLAKVPDLIVIGRTSSFAFKGKNQDLRGIGQALNVKTVLEGSVRKSGDRVRITAQLIDVSNGAHLWSETYDRTLTDIFAVQDSVAAEILAALQIHVGTAPTRGNPTENTDAYSLFLRAKAAMNRWEAANAEEFLLQAVERDPLSPNAQMNLFNALDALGRRSEALAALELAIELGARYAKQDLAVFHRQELRYELSVTSEEANLRDRGLPDSWVRDLHSGASDPLTGQQHLDRRIPEIVASVPEDRAYEMQLALDIWYLNYGFLDRYFELIAEQSDTEILVANGMFRRSTGFTAHPKFLEVAEALDLFELWDERGPPDFCEKTSGEWVCT